MSTQPKYPFYVEPFDMSNRVARFLTAFAAVLQHSNYGFVLDTYARTQTKCARCAATCQVYQASGEYRDVPCNRSDLVLRIYKRYFTLGGMMKARLFGGFHLTERDIDTLAEAVYRCTACRRCKTSCPMGIDHGLITHMARWVLAEIGVVPKALVVAVREQLEGKTGNTSAIPVRALVDTLEFLEEELVENYGIHLKYPVDHENAEYVFLPAVSDYLLEPDTLMGNAAALHYAGCSWTIGTGYFDGINYGLFYGDRMYDRIVQKVVAEVKRLKGKKILVGECGHASRAAKHGVPTFFGRDAPPVVNIMEYTYEAIRSGRLKVRQAIEEPVAYHDPCNIARSGWIIEQPREILRAISKNYVEMTPNRRDNYCCGGGGGTVSIDEIRAFRTGVMGKAKADQVRRAGVKYVVAPCANCKKQIREVMQDHGLDEIEVVGLHDLVLKAIVKPEEAAAPEAPDKEK